MSFYDDESSSDELEAIYTQRRDADLEMAAMNAAADEWHAIRDRGFCNHGSAQGAIGDKTLKRGEVRCTSGCNTVFASDAEWMDACADPLLNPIPLPGHPAHVTLTPVVHEGDTPAETPEQVKAKKKAKGKTKKNDKDKKSKSKGKHRKPKNTHPA
ncbi:hypothetical protein [Streptomyces sp. CS014]|uniref:hypothetical protein n=1 Tax=Streptomyces sp. CS014 TaxID=2162707 RepID=UPI0019529F5C|nr:hypothetical protein [Streptomyces sp. CS014]